MKKILALILLMWIGATVFSQEMKQQNVRSKSKSEAAQLMETTQTHVDRFGATYDWRKSNVECAGCGSFYYAVTRTPEPDYEGKYYYYLFFWSNSFYGNGTQASSYVTGVSVDAILSSGESVHVFGPVDILAKPVTDYFDGVTYVGYVWGLEPDMVISVLWTSVQAY